MQTSFISRVWARKRASDRRNGSLGARPSPWARKACTRSACLRSVMSRTETWLAWAPSYTMEFPSVSTSITEPSRRRYFASSRGTGLPSATCLARSSETSWKSGWTSSIMGLPTTSDRVRAPNIATAAAFT